MPRPQQKYCKRGHLLENNRYEFPSKHKKAGKESGCKKCRTMRMALQRHREDLRLLGIPEQIPTIEEFSKVYFL